MSRPLTTLMTVGVILILAYLWREGKLGALFGAILGPGREEPATEERKDIPYNKRSGDASKPRGSAGSVLDRLKRAPSPDVPEEWKRDGTVVPYPDGGWGEPRGPLKPGEWRPKWSNLAPYPNNSLLWSNN